MSVQANGSGLPEMQQLGIDDRDEYSALAVVAHLSDLLTAAGVRYDLTAGQRPVARIAAAQLLQAMNVRPSNAVGGRTHIAPAQAGPNGRRREAVSTEPLTNVWRKSDRSNNNGACVEVRRVGDIVQVRHSKAAADGPVIDYTLDEWNAFVAGVEEGQFRIA